MSHMSFKAWLGLVFSLCCYTAVGCGDDASANKSAAAGEAGKSSSGASGGGTSAKGGNQATGGSKSGNAGSSSGGTDSGDAGADSGGAGADGGKASGGANNQSGSSSTAGRAGSGSGGAPAATDGCKATNKPATGKQTLDVNGTKRSYYLIASKVADPVPLYLGFHGYGGNGESEQNSFNLQSRAAGKGVFMFPDGVVQSWYQNAIGWDNRNNDNPDMDFVKKLIAEAKAKHCIDSSRIFVTGFSWGGWMATQVACALGDQLRGFASGGGGGPMNKTNCQPTSGLIMHGTNDGSEGINSGRTSRDNFVKLNKCQSTTTPVFDNHCVSYAGCELPVWWCEHDGGHEVASGWGQDAVWDFFQKAPAR